MKMAFQPAVSAFLITWAYEEFFHGRALERLLAECGQRLEQQRVENVARKSRLNEWLEAALGPLLSRAFTKELPAVYMSFGAIQELTTLRGYERLRELTTNPVLKYLCEAIAKQERRHFAWYFNSAKELLAKSPCARLLTRILLKLNWAPVGAGVKSKAEVDRLFGILFPRENGERLVREIDSKVGTLPGLEGIALMEPYFRRLITFTSASAIACSA
jgi:rubrerythrin